MGNIASWIWVLIPLAAIFSGTFTAWAKMKSKQRELGSSTEDLERAVEVIKADLREHQSSLEKRIANLEVIVTSQTWDTLHDGALSAEDKKLLVENSRTELEALQQDLSDERKVELLTRRIK